MTDYQRTQAVITKLEDRIAEVEEINRVVRKACEGVGMEDPDIQESERIIKDLKHRLQTEKIRLLDLN